MIVIRPATKDDASYIGTHLREDDEREVQTSAGQPGSTVVPLAFQISRETYAVFRCPNGKPQDSPCALFGVADDPDPTLGVIWFLATDEIRRCALSVIRETRRWLDHLSRDYSNGLHNYADLRNDLHVRWAQLTGFSIDGETLRDGHRFIHIIYNKPSECVNPPLSRLLL